MKDKRNIEIFLYKESGKWIFFIKNPNLTTTKKNSGGWEGRGWGVARVSDFFSGGGGGWVSDFFYKEAKSKIKKKQQTINLILGWGGGGGGEVEGLE